MRLKVSARAANNSKVTSVMCLFCSTCDREVKPGHQRRPTTRPKVFQSNEAVYVSYGRTAPACRGNYWRFVFHPDDVDGISHESALTLFEGKEAGSGGEIIGYVTRVKHQRKFNHLIKLIACGSTFCKAAQQMECVKVETGIGDYGGCSDAITANYDRVVCAQSLQLLSECISPVWTFFTSFQWINPSRNVQFECSSTLRTRW